MIKFVFVLCINLHLYTCMHNIHLHIYIQDALEELQNFIEDLYIGLKSDSEVAIQVSLCVYISLSSKSFG